MALENTDQDNPSEEIEEKSSTAPRSNDDTGEEQQHILAPPGICDICAEFYHFLVSGILSPNIYRFTRNLLLTIRLIFPI